MSNMSYLRRKIVRPESKVPKSKVPKSRPKGLGLTLKSQSISHHYNLVTKYYCFPGGQWHQLSAGPPTSGIDQWDASNWPIRGLYYPIIRARVGLCITTVCTVTGQRQPRPPWAPPPPLTASSPRPHPRYINTQVTSRNVYRKWCSLKWCKTTLT